MFLSHISQDMDKWNHHTNCIERIKSLSSPAGHMRIGKKEGDGSDTASGPPPDPGKKGGFDNNISHIFKIFYILFLGGLSRNYFRLVRLRVQKL